jgi:rhamnulokinase
MSWHLAIDLGAGSGRAILGSVTPDALVVSEVHRFHYAPRASAGYLRWDIDALFEGVRAGVAAAGAAVMAAGGTLDSVGVDSWGVDYGLIGTDGRLVEEPICYRDSRTDGMVEYVCGLVPRGEIFAHTGIQFLQLNTLCQLAAHVRDGLPEGAARLLLIPDLCHHELCGSTSSERTDASTTQLLNPLTGTWDRELFAKAGLPFDLMPPLVETGTVLGQLLPRFRTCAALERTRVIAPPTHDTASAVAATPLGDGWAYISSGTWSLVGVERPQPTLDEAALEANFTNEAGAFGSIRFLKNVMGLWLLEGCRKEWADAGHARPLTDLLSAVAATSGFPGVVFPDDGRFFNPPSMVKAIQGALADTGQTPVDDPVLLAKVIIDSLAFRYQSVVAKIEACTGVPVAGIHVVGGGSLNDCLNQATANATRRPVLAGPAEATATGNLLVQAIAAGTLHSLAEGRALVARHQPPRRFEPRAVPGLEAAAARYAEVEAAGA